MHADVIACICALCEFRDAERLLSTCRALHGLTRCDSFFRMIGEMQWGHAFWEQALRRPCFREFMSMRDELRLIDCFQRNLRSRKLRQWTVDDFRRFWQYEASITALKGPHHFNKPWRLKAV